jgi:uncharacterized protein
MSTINQQLKAYGFRYVTLDLQGFESGRMNEELPEAQKTALVG